ncbi:MAG TPA: trypsin-like serine protease, partial [Polyangiaceae bacterium]
VVVQFQSHADDLRLALEASVAAVHPELDLLLLMFDESEPLAATTPIGLATSSLGIDTGDLVQVAGFGVDAHGVLGRRAFLVSQVLKSSTSTLRVDSAMLGGACFGDSGGPLLVRDESGRVRTLGILSTGSSDCFGQDSYTRIDPQVADWVAESTGIDCTNSSANAGGQVLGTAGRCFEQLAVWYDDGELQTQACSSEEPCGWSGVERGFRCVKAADDPCEGVSDVGECDGDVAVRCVDGRLEGNPCAACGVQCARSPQTGSPMPGRVSATRGSAAIVR